MTYAIIETGGKQIKVEPGRFYDIELLTAQPDEKVTIEAVLLVQHEGEVTIGQPLVSGATVEGTILRHFRDRKVLVYKMKPKKKTRKKRGHRQEVTRLMIDSITFNGKVFAVEAGMYESESPVLNETSAEVETYESPILDETSAEAETYESPVLDETPAEAGTDESPIVDEISAEEAETVAE